MKIYSASSCGTPADSPVVEAFRAAAARDRRSASEIGRWSMWPDGLAALARAVQLRYLRVPLPALGVLRNVSPEPWMVRGLPPQLHSGVHPSRW